MLSRQELLFYISSTENILPILLSRAIVNPYNLYNLKITITDSENNLESEGEEGGQFYQSCGCRGQISKRANDR